MKMLDWTWRLPVAVLIRAPLMIAGYSLEWLGLRLADLASSIPGLPYFGRRS